MYQLEWAVIYMVVTVDIMLFLPFPTDFIDALFAFLVLSWYKRNQLFRKLDVDPRRNSIGRGTDFRGIKVFFRSISPSKGSPSAENDYGPLKYYFMKGTEHREIACPKCGSKMKILIGYYWINIHYQICVYCVAD
jgi:hypothetical protein